MTNRPRTRLAFVSLAAAIALSLVGATGAQAALVQVTGSTTVTPSAAATQFLTTNGIAVTPTGPATAANGSFTFPVVAGFGDVPSYNGVLAHSGGLNFAKGNKSLVVRRFVAVRAGKTAVLLAQLPGKRGNCGALTSRLAKFASKKGVRGAAKKYPKATRAVLRAVRDYCSDGRVIVLANLTNLGKSVNGTTATLTADLALTAEAAKLINKLVPDATGVSAGVVFGSAVSTVTPKS